MGIRWLMLLLAIIAPAAALADDQPSRAGVSAALLKAAKFHREQVARHGGYVYASSGDLKLREGEGVAAEHAIWVQPPGTPSVGEAFLLAYQATGDRFHLQAAQDAGHALVRGQLQSGGWNYSITFDPEARPKHFYRRDLDGKLLDITLPKNKLLGKDGRALAAGWDTWRGSRISGNQTVLDDETTQAAARFLCKLDRATEFKDDRVHEAALYALKSLLAAQYPSGGWSANYDRFPTTPPSKEDYPVVPAALPDEVSQTWPKDFTGCYVTNDDLIPDMLATLFVAYDIYRDEQYLAAARRAGDFLLLAQLPDPQPAWAQQYDKAMQPVWCRAFEPPAVTGGESQGILEALLLLYRHTGEKKYLEPIPRAIAYLRKSELPGKKLARFYELRTNRPIYFTRNAGGKHEWTYADDKIASGYAYIVSSKVDRIEAEYEKVRALAADKLLPGEKPPGAASEKLIAETRRVLAALDERGAWVERGRLQHHKVEPETGVIRSETFIANVTTMCRYLNAK